MLGASQTARLLHKLSSVQCNASWTADSRSDANLQLHIGNVFAKRNTGRSVNNFDSDGGFALGFEDIVNQVLGSEVDIASSVWVVLTQHTLRVKTP